MFKTDQTSTDYNVAISWQGLICWAVNDITVSIFSILPTKVRFSTLYLNPIGLIIKAVSRDYACLMSPNKDETGCRLSRKLLLLAVWWSSLFSWIVSCIAFIIYVTVPKKVNLNVLPVERIKTMLGIFTLTKYCVCTVIINKVNIITRKNNWLNTYNKHFLRIRNILKLKRLPLK